MMVELIEILLYMSVGIFITLGYNTAKTEFIHICIRRVEAAYRDHVKSDEAHFEAIADDIIELDSNIEKLNNPDKAESRQ